MEEIKKVKLDQEPEKKFKFRLKLKKVSFRLPSLGKKWVALVLALIFLLLAAVLVPSFFILKNAKGVYSQAWLLEEAMRLKDLKMVKEQIWQTRDSLGKLEGSLKPIAWTRFIPFIGVYEVDAVHLVRAGEAGLEAAEIVVAAVEPYADIIGLSSSHEEGGGEKTAEDRIDFVVSTIEKVTPEIEKIGEKLAIAKREIDQVDPNRYPPSFRGQKIRKPLSELIALVDQAALLTSEAKPLLEKTPWLLGIDEPRRYLILFQNDGELRPTGGFMTAYALLEVDKGKLAPLLSEDMYALDARFTPTERAPEALTSYIAFPYGQDPRWRLRDMNISPDFKVSMQQFIENFQKTSNARFDGVVAIDTRVLVRLLAVLGPVGVPEWGNFSAEPDKRCDGCPQVVYELERLITKPTYEIKEARKAVIGPLMHSILANAFGSPKERLPALFNAGFTSLVEKDVLFYFPEEELQSAVESFNLAGRIRDFEGDFFHLNDTNLGGAKANMFIKQKVSQEVTIGKNGEVVKEVQVEYKNPSPHSYGCDPEAGGLCLNAPYRNWFRLYVPAGSELLESLGSEVEVKTYEELGKTVFEGYYGKKAPLNPDGGYTKVVFKYKLPFKVDKSTGYKLLIQKQPGTRNPEYEVILGGKTRVFELKKDEELEFGL